MIPALLAAGLAVFQADSTLPAPRVVDDFEEPGGWTAHPADGVAMSLASDRGIAGQALRMDFAFESGGGYAIARRTLALDLPGNYVFSFWLRGEAPPNTLEFKLVDASGENVWWYTERDRAFDGAWHKVKIRKRQVSFAWGPAGGGEIRQVAAIELVITAGRGGGKGTLWFDDLRLTPLPELGPYDATPVATGRAHPGHPASLALDHDTATAWRPTPGRAAVFTLDFLRAREFGGLTLLWEPGRGARDYDVLLSEDGHTWRLADSVRGADGGRDDVPLPETEARGLRLVLRRPLGNAGYGLRELVVQPLAYGASRNAMFETIAAASPPGVFPRYFTGRRAYWTVVGVDEAREEALFNEDGALEAGAGEFSVEPFLQDGTRLFTWHDGTRSPALLDGVLPIPSVEWHLSNLTCTITAFATGPASSSSAVVRYRLRNPGPLARQPTLLLAIRPFQVNPPWQFLNIPGGVARIDSLRWDGRGLHVNGRRTVYPLVPPSQVGLSTFAGGEVVQHLLAGTVAGRGSAREVARPQGAAGHSVRDAFGAASGVLAFPLSLAPGDSAEVAIEVPLVAGAPPRLTAGGPAAASQAMAEAADRWRRMLDRGRVDLPPSGQRLARSLRATLGWILINRDGPAIQPGSRAYERSWIRDGALTSAALLRFGYPEVVRSFIEWFARYQYPNGKVPCCVDHRGPDPVPEHDSHGEFIYVVMEYWRHTGDRALLEAMWPRVAKAVAYLDSLRQTRRTQEYRTGANRIFFGLLPPSISHEGYSAKPMHSYWDDFFAFRGFKDAAAMAAVLGRREDAARIAAIRDEFRGDLRASIAAVQATRGLDYLPGAADLGDFDPTSTTIALSPVGAEADLSAPALRATFERYWNGAMSRADSGSTWDAYTPYELRAVGALLRLGWKVRALRLLDLLLRDQEPPGWHQWPEVVYRDRRAPRFIGDLPHTWVGSDFLRSAADLFAYEREADSALVLGAGLDEGWLADSGVAVRDLSTWWGRLSYTARADGDHVTFGIASGLRVPPGGIRVVSPRERRARRALLDGVAVPPATGDTVRVDRVPALVIFEY
jgi:hypothetical protein